MDDKYSLIVIDNKLSIIEKTTGRDIFSGCLDWEYHIFKNKIDIGVCTAEFIEWLLDKSQPYNIVFAIPKEAMTPVQRKKAYNNLSIYGKAKFIENGYGYPAKPKQAGYPDSWKKHVVEEDGEQLRAR